jgi:predicted dehydrogenase
MNKQLKFLVIGCGSIGQRHIKTLLSLGFENIEVYDTNKKMLKKIKKYTSVKILNSLEFNEPDCTFICTPPNLHAQLMLKALKFNSNVFVEKPISNSMKQLKKISELAKQKSLHVFVGYVLRFDNGLTKIKKIISEGKLGKILSINASYGWYLPNWRPTQNYRKNYTASIAQGGGIILDASHDVNYLQWLCGDIEEVFCWHSKISQLRVETEGLAEILLKFKSKTLGHIHLDFINPKDTRHCEIIGSKATIRWSFTEQTIEFQKNLKIQHLKFKDNSEEIYKDEIKYIIKCLKGEKNHLIDIISSISTLEVSLAAKKSGKTNKSIVIKNLL